jgi:hypothetical protein
MKLRFLTIRGLCELVLYDIVTMISGFDGVRKWLIRDCAVTAPSHLELTTIVSAAVDLAACLCFKRVRCLQRSVVTVRLLRKRGIPGRLVIGYRSSPFLMHAWTEVDGKIVNDLPGYAERLRVLGKF